MDYGISRLRIAALATVALASAAALFYYGTGEYPLWWAAPCAILILLLAAPRLPGLIAFAIGATAFFLGSLNMLRYTRNILALPDAAGASAIGSVPFAILAFMVVPACALGAAVVLFRFFVRRGRLWQGALAFAFTWAAYEYLASVVSPHGTFGNFAYTQMEDLPLLQLASVTGVWGISFCAMLLPAALAALFVEADAAQKRALGAGATAFFVAVAVFGFWRLQPQSDPSVAVGLMASDLPENVDISDPGKDTQRKLNAYVAHADGLIARGARIIILPEKLGVTVPATAISDDVILQSLADRSRVTVMAGLVRSAQPHLFNEARIYEPSRRSPLTYDKQHMLPRFESQLTPGAGRLLLDHGHWGVAVCKDMDFPSLARRYGNDGVGLLLVSAWDFDDDDWLHARMAVMRGVESGFSVARAAKEGLLSVSDDRGRILAYESSKAAPFTALLARAPLRHEATIYDRFGDWFAWVCLTGLAVILGSAALSRGRRRR